ncbi:protein SICKLE [Andrographis paniculata]|uniref:protein SICKLE n=1 Tax=Andrographis paniculata TaxID=175694 RepID=UPI0021E97A9F|nr:protein SICKLE [Andrographis paniculata]
MEESEKRRERLKAMRMEAAQAGVDEALGGSGLPFSGLSNPLIESSETISTHNYPRFDYYTDPMSAFSGSRSNHNLPPRAAYQSMTPSPSPSPLVHRYPPQNSPSQRMYQAPATHFNQGPPPPRSPMEGFGRPPGMYQAPATHFNQGPPPPTSLMGRFGRPPGNPPHAWGGSGGTFNYRPPPNLSGGGNNFAGPIYSRGRGRGQWNNSNPHYWSERGRSQPHDSGRGRGRGTGPSGRRGASSHEPISAELRPDLYYSKQMVEDPWKMLTPCIWKGVDDQTNKQSWLPESISMKRAKVSPESSKISIPQPSLAEYLAASFDDQQDAA